MSSARPPIRVLLQAHFRADPRKTTVLALLVVVLIAACVRWWLKSSSPATADASQVAGAVDPSLLPLGHNGDESAQAVLPPREPVDLPARQELSRDPFAIDLEAFPWAATGEPTDNALPAVDMTEERIRAAAAQLVLQMILHDDSPLACISGRIVRPGQKIDGFVVSRIDQAQVVLHRQGVEITLDLNWEAD
jgi:hypothetical protein